MLGWILSGFVGKDSIAFQYRRGAKRVRRKWIMLSIAPRSIRECRALFFNCGKTGLPGVYKESILMTGVSRRARSLLVVAEGCMYRALFCLRYPGLQ
ncbi:hypothetical protein KCP69_02890 [Salmonella enterica subsp. enterica]|nr:hypothetical protein KCP69_02890 [Salmonella enterica subsp. enterica]